MSEANKPLPSSGYTELLLFFLRRRWRVEVTGNSMLPTLPAGTELLVNRTAYKNKPPQIGDIVVAQHPDQPKLKVIKRIAEVGETTVTILGDNPTESTDSRHYGAISRSLLLGKITSQWTPMKRRK